MSDLVAAIATKETPTVGENPIRSKAPVWLVLVGLLGLTASVVVGLALPNLKITAFAGGFFRLDATSKLFLLVVNAIVLGVATYVWTRVNAIPALQAGVARYVAFCVAFVLACNLAILSNHLIALWVLLELSTLAAVPLIQHGGLAATRASWKYLLFSGVGLALALLGFLCLEQGLESHGSEVGLWIDGLTSISPGPLDAWGRIGLALVFLGLGTKLGLAPMYAWLPETYEAAPPATTALLAAVQFNVALVALLRVLEFARRLDPFAVSYELVGLGLATMLVSALSIIAARNYKRLIAYAALNHAGVIAIGLGIGREATYGVIVYVVSNAFIKAILFLTAGKIQAHYRSSEMADVSGLIKDLPYSGMFFMVGVFALLGLPPFGSFLGELILMSGLISRGLISVFVAFCVVLTVTFVATGRAVFPMIWGEPRKKADWASQPIASILPKLVFLSALIAMGIYLPAPVNALFRQVATSLGAP
ncbi:MAG: hypothetical protein JST54_01890 [Deltaproteobacteria bacterium]|nr:hypothetical protein [Deltaproteobacteria bacterium]